MMMGGGECVAFNVFIGAPLQTYNTHLEINLLTETAFGQRNERIQQNNVLCPLIYF